MTLGRCEGASRQIAPALSIAGFGVEALNQTARSSQSEGIGASGKAITVDSCRRNDDVGATLIGAKLSLRRGGPEIESGRRCRTALRPRSEPTLRAISGKSY